MAQTHICGQCEVKFDSEETYLEHTCESSGFTPQEPEHLGEDFTLVQHAALLRGATKAEGEEKERTEKAIEDLGVTPLEPQ